MKKIKLITPILVTSAMGGAIAPALTSCGGTSKPTVTQYTVTFSCTEGVTLSSTESIKVSENTKWSDVNKPTATVAEGYADIGWYNSTDMQLVTDDMIITKDTDVKYLAFDKSKVITNVTVTTAKKKYDPVPFVQGGTFGEFKEYYPEMKQTPEKEGEHFVGWYVGDTKLTDDYVFPAQAQISISARFSDHYYVDLASVDETIRGSFLASVVAGQNYVVYFTIPEAKIALDFDKWDITVGGNSVKGQGSVKLTENQVFIPAALITDNIAIKITLRDATFYTISTTGSSADVKFGIPSPRIKEGKNFEATYGLNDSLLQKVDLDNSDILIGSNSIKDKTDVEWKNDKIKIPASYINNNITLKIITKSNLLTTSLTDIITYCNQLESGAIADKETFAKKFKTSSGNVTSSDDLIGSLITTTINSQTHYLRIIDVQHANDLIVQGGTVTTTPAALTFDMVTLLSDAEGNAIKTSYDTANNRNYLNSILRWNLNGNGSGTKPESGVWTNSAFSMLPTELQAGIKTVNKQVSTTSSLTLTNYADKLFPLTYTEIGAAGHQYAKVEGTVYKFWGDSHNLSKRDKDCAAGGNRAGYFCSTPSVVATKVFGVWSTSSFVDEMKVEIPYGVSFGFCL